MESKNKNTGLVVIIVILLLAVIGLGGYIVYDKVLKDLSNGTVNNDNKTSDNLKDNNQDGKTTKNNNYQLFASNLKNEFSKFSSHNRPYLNVQSMMENGDYVVYLTENQELYIKYYKEELKNKFGDYKITDKVIGYNVVPTGNGGGKMLYFINEDGTVGSADIEFISSSNIAVKKDLGYKNIVSIVGGIFGLGGGGAYDVIFVDINGRIHSPSEYLFN